jgi:hypothetical protein
MADEAGRAVGVGVAIPLALSAGSEGGAARRPPPHQGRQWGGDRRR